MNLHMFCSWGRFPVKVECSHLLETHTLLCKKSIVLSACHRFHTRCWRGNTDHSKGSIPACIIHKSNWPAYHKRQLLELLLWCMFPVTRCILRSKKSRLLLSRLLCKWGLRGRRHHLLAGSSQSHIICKWIDPRSCSKGLFANWQSKWWYMLQQESVRNRHSMRCK